MVLHASWEADLEASLKAAFEADSLEASSEAYFYNGPPLLTTHCCSNFLEIINQLALSANNSIKRNS